MRAGLWGVFGILLPRSLQCRPIFHETLHIWFNALETGNCKRKKLNGLLKSDFLYECYIKVKCINEEENLM